MIYLPGIFIGEIVTSSSSTLVLYVDTNGKLNQITGATSDGTNLSVTTQAASDNSTKAASTAYVTTGIANAIAGVNPAVAVQAATAAVLPNSPTYNNGVSGIGATLTAGVTNTALVVDGYTPALNDRVLVKNQASAFQNGVYFVSQLAALGLAWVLTRALDYDQPSDINNTGAIPVINGTANTSTSWVITSKVTTVGTDALTYTQFSLNPTTILTTSSFANPTASVGLSAVNGSATTPMRSDAAPALSQAIVPTWTGNHLWQPSSDSATVLEVETNGGTAVFDVDTSNQRVGIGTAAPGEDLDVSKSLNGNVIARVNNSNTGSSATSRLILGNNTNSVGFQIIYQSSNNTSFGPANCVIFGQSENAPMTFQTNGTERVRIDATGKVGIATTAPSTLLHVGLAGTTTGTIGVAGSTSGLITITPNNTAGTWTLTLPANGGTNKYALTTDGSGVSSWNQIDLTAAVTGTLPVANGGTGDTGTAWGTWSPTVTTQTGGPPTVTVNAARFKTIGKTTFVSFDITVTNTGGGTGLLQVTLPNTSKAHTAIFGFETAVTGKSCQGILNASSGTCSIDYFDGTSVLANGIEVVFGGSYEST